MVQSLRSSSELPSALPVIASVRDNIRAQLKASRDIFVLVQKMAEVARSTNDDAIRSSLEKVMSELLEVGKHLSEGATETGNQVVDFMRSQAPGNLR